MRAFYQKMKTKGFKSKVEKLEQLKIELDDTGNSENTVGLTNQTNYNTSSKKQTFKRKRKAFGFVESSD